MTHIPTDIFKRPPPPDIFPVDGQHLGSFPLPTELKPQVPMTDLPIYKDIFEIVGDHDKAVELFRLVDRQRILAATYGLGSAYLQLRED
jgi:hypothetical protein